MDQEQKNILTEKMNRTLAILNKEFTGLRTGRASAHLLDPIIIEAYGSKTPLSQVGTVSTPDAKTITVQVWDKKMVKTIEKAIIDANLGLSPSSDGQLIRMNLPTLSEERRKELVRLAHKYGENTKIALRNIRRDAMDILKKMKKDNEISKDEQYDYASEIQKLTDKFISKIDSTVKFKEEEILTI